MADIRLFCGIRYDQSMIGNPASVICPPYDIITTPMRHELYQISEYNFVRLEDGWGSPEDTAADSKYTRAAATMEHWLAQGVLKADAVPAVYLHDHYFKYQGQEYRRRGIIARVRLEEPGEMVVRRHEGTLAEPKNDRLSLLWALQANTSPVLALFEDHQQQVASLLAAQEKVEPEIDFNTADGERHQVRAITEAIVIDRLNHSLANRALYIADGHHRYESALIYRQQRGACSPSVSGDEMFNFVMMTLVDFADPGLVVLPPHRLIRGVSRARLSGLMAGLGAFFSVEALPLATPDIWKQVDRFLGMVTDEVRLVLFGEDSENLYLLKLSDPAAASRMMPYFHSELYKKLAVSVVDHVVLEELLGLSGGADEAVGYCYDKADAVQKVLDREYQLAFLLSPTRAEVVKAIADAGDRMPRKSTYFYPKAPAGLVFNRLA
jgi:uncharacterized protein (DUF1015 family)